MRQTRKILGLGIIALFAFSGSGLFAADYHERPAPSLTGETGLFRVLQANTLCKRQLTVQLSYQQIKRDPGAVMVEEGALAFGYGLTDKLEVSLVLRALSVDIDHDPDDDVAFYNGKFIGGPSKEDGTGNPHFGVKYNFVKERQGMIGLAGHIYMDLPRGDEQREVDLGGTSFMGTGKAQYGGSLIASKAFGWVGTNINVGYTVFDGVETPGNFKMNNWFTYGLGLHGPVGKPLQGIVEVNGYSLAENNSVSDSVATAVGLDGNRIPDDDRLYFTGGFRFLSKKGFSAAVAGTYTEMNFSGESEWGAIAKIAWTSGCATARTAPPPPPAAEVMPEAAAAVTDFEQQNLPPTLRLMPEKTVVMAGEKINISALAQDPEGQPLNYEWMPESGVLTGMGEDVMWQAPEDCDEIIEIKAQVADDAGQTATDAVSIKVICPDGPEVIAEPLERVFFEFDRSYLTPKMQGNVDKVIAYMKLNPNVTVIVEGHTCSIATDEYNMALGQRRAASIRNYMVSKGIAGSRLKAISYGEIRPAFGNSTEDSRRKNRRGDFKFSE